MIMVATKAVLYLFDSKSSGKQQLIFPAYLLHETQQILLMDKVLVQYFWCEWMHPDGESEWVEMDGYKFWMRLDCCSLLSLPPGFHFL